MEDRSGKRQRLMIACVITEVAVVVDPVVFYEIDRVHLIHYVRNPDDPGNRIYKEFYDEVVRQLKERRPEAEIVEHFEKVYYYHDMLRTVLNIFGDENARTDGNMDLYVNITSGRSEYAAAAMMGCMFHHEMIPFTVRAEERTLSPEDFRRIYYEGDRPVGQYLTVKDPVKVQTFDPSVMTGDMIEMLDALDSVNSRCKRPYALDYIEELKDRNLWNYDPDSNRSKSTAEQKERMYLRRAVFDPLIDCGCVRKSRNAKSKYEITSEGRAVLDIFGTKRRGPSPGADPGHPSL